MTSSRRFGSDPSPRFGEKVAVTQARIGLKHAILVDRLEAVSASDLCAGRYSTIYESN